MTREKSIVWLESLKTVIGQHQYQGLWHYEQALAETIELLQSDRLVELPCKVGRFVYVDTRLFCTDCLKEEVRKLDYICCNVVNFRYDKPPIAKCYCKDCKFHIDGICTNLVNVYTANEFFCCLAQRKENKK